MGRLACVCAQVDFSAQIVHKANAPTIAVDTESVTMDSANAKLVLLMWTAQGKLAQMIAWEGEPAKMVTAHAKRHGLELIAPN